MFQYLVLSFIGSCQCNCYFLESLIWMVVIIECLASCAVEWNILRASWNNKKNPYWWREYGKELSSFLLLSKFFVANVLCVRVRCQNVIGNRYFKRNKAGYVWQQSPCLCMQTSTLNTRKYDKRGFCIWQHIICQTPTYVFCTTPVTVHTRLTKIFFFKLQFHTIFPYVYTYWWSS